MKRILITSTALALFGATSASACLVDSGGVAVRSSDGSAINAGSIPCSPGVGAAVPSSAVLGNAILFGAGSAVLSAQGRALLDTIDASSIRTITGYASIDGSDDSNLALSRARAQTIADYLGVDATVIGGGETTQFGPSLAANRVVVLS